MSERKTTRFAVLEAERVVKVHEREIPALKADEVLIKNGACNICTTDYGQYTGARKNLMFPMAWGHEFAGTVVDMGSDVKEFEVGEMVGIGYDNCGECEFCKKGLTSECVTLGAGRNKLSPDGYHGGFGCSEYVIKPYRSLFKLNQTMDPSEAAFVEPVGTVCQGIRKLRVQQGEKIVVIGAGTMGVLNALVAKAEGCEVMITEMMDKKIEVAKELGLNVVDVKEKDPVEAVKEWTGGRGVDAVILAVGVTAANDQALEMIKQLHGRILMFAAGYPAPELHVDSNLIHYRKMELIGTFSADKCDFERAAELMREKKIDLSKLVEARYKLDDVKQAFEAAIVPGAYRVSVVFDEAAKDEMRQSVLRLSKPQRTKLVIKSIEDSIRAIKSGVTDKYNLFIVVNNIQDAERLVAGISELKYINLGVLPATKDSKALSKAIYVTADDIKSLKKLLNQGIKIDIQQVPTESIVTVNEKLLKE